MTGTYSQCYVHVVFPVKGRMNLLAKEWRSDLFKYMSGIITGKSQKSIIVNGVSDHVHLLIGFKPIVNISEIVRDVKNNSTNFINNNKLVLGKFAWQEGFGAFTHSHGNISTVYNYILNQETHHAKKTFRQEYVEWLNTYEVEHEERFLFDWLE